MTNPIEQDFYKAFDIKGEPPITDRILLELICVVNKYNLDFILDAETYNDLKNIVLVECINTIDLYLNGEEFITEVRKIIGVNNEN